MDDFYEDDGWEASIATPRKGGGMPLIEMYVVAIKDRAEAEAKIISLICDGAKIMEMMPVGCNVMQGHTLFPGNWMKIPVLQ